MPPICSLLHHGFGTHESPSRFQCPALAHCYSSAAPCVLSARSVFNVFASTGGAVANLKRCLRGRQVCGNPLQCCCGHATSTALPEVVHALKQENLCRLTTGCQAAYCLRTAVLICITQHKPLGDLAPLQLCPVLPGLEEEAGPATCAH